MKITLSKLRGAFIAVGVPFILYGGILIHGYDGGPYLRGDCPFYFFTCEALIKNHDLDIQKVLDGGIPADFASLSKDNRVVAKHPILMPVMALPLVALFGEVGTLVFNQLQLAAVLLLLYFLALRHFGIIAAAAAVVLTGTGTCVPYFVWNFSPDLFSAFLLLSALLALPPKTADFQLNTNALLRCGLSGIFFGAAFYTKMTMIIFPAFAIVLIPRPFLRTLPAFATGTAIPLLAYGALNQHLFGSPFISSYDRILELRDGKLVVESARGAFALSNLPVGFVGQFIDPQVGLLTTSPLTLLSLLGLPLLFKQARFMTIYIVLTSSVLFFLFATCIFYNASDYGNRYLMPMILLATLPLAAAIEYVRERYAGRAR